MGKIIPFKGVQVEGQGQERQESVLGLVKPTFDEIFMHELAHEDYDADEIIPVKDWNGEMWAEFMSKCEEIARAHNNAHWIETGEAMNLSAWAVFGTVLGALLEASDNG